MENYLKKLLFKASHRGTKEMDIILGKFATTGDGLLVALEVLFSMRKGKKASELFNTFAVTPQILENIKVDHERKLLAARAKQPKAEW